MGFFNLFKKKNNDINIWGFNNQKSILLAYFLQECDNALIDSKYEKSNISKLYINSEDTEIDNNTIHMNAMIAYVSGAIKIFFDMSIDAGETNFNKNELEEICSEVSSKILRIEPKVGGITFLEYCKKIEEQSYGTEYIIYEKGKDAFSNFLTKGKDMGGGKVDEFIEFVDYASKYNK